MMFEAIHAMNPKIPFDVVKYVEEFLKHQDAFANDPDWQTLLFAFLHFTPHDAERKDFNEMGEQKQFQPAFDDDQKEEELQKDVNNPENEDLIHDPAEEEDDRKSVSIEDDAVDDEYVLFKALSMMILLACYTPF